MGLTFYQFIMKTSNHIQYIFSIIFRIFLSILILFFMTTIIWNNLAKSQDNPETIEQAIDRKIAAHNNSTISHNEPGQSLDLHRKDTIVDHPAGSIKNDKFSRADYEYNIHFSDFTYWTKSLFSLNQSEMRAYSSLSGTNLNAYLIRELPISSDLSLDKASFVLSNSMIVELGNSTQNFVTFGIGGWSDINYPDFGFVFKNGKTFISYYDNDLSNYNLVDLNNNSFTDSDKHHYRIEYIKSENVVNFYIDGQLVHTLTSANNFQMWASDPFIISRAVRSSNSAPAIYVSMYQPFLSLDYTY